MAGALCIAALTAPAGASAATVSCDGSTKLDNTLDQANGVAYRFHCDEDLVGYTIATSKKIDYFNPAPGVFDPVTGDPSATDSFACEGGFPSYGFGCNGKSTANYIVASDFATTGSVCASKPSHRLHTWVVAVVIEIVDNGVTQTPTTKSSEPFPLSGPKCTYKPARHGHR